MFLILKKCRLPPVVILGKLCFGPSFSGEGESFDAAVRAAYRKRAA